MEYILLLYLLLINFLSDRYFWLYLASANDIATTIDWYSFVFIFLVYLSIIFIFIIFHWLGLITSLLYLLYFSSFLFMNYFLYIIRIDCYIWVVDISLIFLLLPFFSLLYFFFVLPNEPIEFPIIVFTINIE